MAGKLKHWFVVCLMGGPTLKAVGGRPFKTYSSGQAIGFYEHKSGSGQVTCVREKLTALDAGDNYYEAMKMYNQLA